MASTNNNAWRQRASSNTKPRFALIWYCCALWWFFLSNLVGLLKFTVVSDAVRVRLINSAAAGQPIAHGMAIVYDAVPACGQTVSDITHPDWFLMQGLSEHEFCVDRPHLLQKPTRSTLKSVVHEFRLLGFQVKELHVKIHGHTMVHFLG